MNQTLYISGNIESTKNADHILEMAGLGEFCDYYLWKFTSKIRLTNKCSKLYQKSRRYSSRLAYCHVSWDTLQYHFKSLLFDPHYSGDHCSQLCAGASPAGQFVVDCEVYNSLPHLGQNKNLYILHNRFVLVLLIGFFNF